MSRLSFEIVNEEAEAKLAIIRDSALHTLRRHYVPLPQAQARRSSLPACRTLVASQDAAPLGYVRFYIEAHTLHALDLAVLESARRRGIGRALMQELEQIAAREGCHLLSLWTVEETGNAALFERLGCAVVHRERSALFVAAIGGGPIHELRLERRLRASS
jgi:GNAT superfamily N-acetyltransferase